MKMTSLAVMLALAAVSLAPVARSEAPAASNGKTETKSDKQQKDQRSHQDQDDGERIFEANCSRCHNAPEGFSPRISGTIVRHMRMRASLSAHDEQELLRFFNP
ncbi:cytochrome c [Silvibacterium acidisoli]|uniref:cytochrome c n=1 Tax=Acidobacteriaceae bacterium ZG23-2 TaxID=2883246 RepID=UPI00406D3C7B